MSSTILRSALVCFLLVSGGCAEFITKEAQPKVNINANPASQYVHRGMVQVEDWVFVPGMTCTPMDPALLTLFHRLFFVFQISGYDIVLSPIADGSGNSGPSARSGLLRVLTSLAEPESLRTHPLPDVVDVVGSGED